MNEVKTMISNLHYKIHSKSGFHELLFILVLIKLHKEHSKQLEDSSSDS